MIIFNIIILLFLLFLNIFFSYELLVNIEDYLEVHNHLKKSIGLPVIGCYFNNRLQVNYVARSEKKNQVYSIIISIIKIINKGAKACKLKVLSLSNSLVTKAFKA